VFERFRRSVELTKASLAVLRADRELLIYPLISFVGVALVSISFAVPFLVTGAFTRTTESGVDPVTLALGFAYYVVIYTVIFFFNTALVGAAMIRLDGGNPTLSDGFRIAASRLPAIIGYAALAATVGMVLRAISERVGLLGQLVVGLIGFAWNVATFLVVPVLVVEGVGPVEAIKRSAGLLRKTWGEQLIGNVGIGLVFGLLTLGVFIVGGLLVALLASISGLLALVAVVALIVAVAILALVGSAVGGIFTASLYRYATTGDAGPMFQTETVAAAFRPKGSR